MRKGTIFSISISPEMGMGKTEIQEAMVIMQGIKNDGYAGEWGREWGRQISCLNLSSVINLSETNNCAVPGKYNENILVDGIDLLDMTVGDRMKLGKDVILEVTQIGKEDHTGSPPLGIDLLSHEGVFCKVINCGRIKKGDTVEVFVKQMQDFMCK